jgi:hypothetical protein
MYIFILFPFIPSLTPEYADTHSNKGKPPVALSARPATKEILGPQLPVLPLKCIYLQGCAKPSSEHLIRILSCLGI